MTVEKRSVCDVEPWEGGPGFGVADTGLDRLDRVVFSHLSRDGYGVAVDHECAPGMVVLDFQDGVRIRPSFDCAIIGENAF